MRLNINPTVKNMAIGAISEEVTRGAAMYVLGKAGAYYIPLEIRSPTGKWIWGVGTNDLLSLGVGAGIMLYGTKKNNTRLKEMGQGWLLGFTCVKLIAEPLYGLIMAYDPVYAQALGTQASLVTARPATPTPVATASKYSLTA
jgi:hypothetical protein